jgi:amino acid permease
MSRMRAVVHAAVLVSGLAYLIVGVFGYLTFLEETEGNIFNNYDDDILVGTLCCSVHHILLMTTVVADVAFAPQKLARSSWPWSSCT